VIMQPEVKILLQQLNRGGTHGYYWLKQPDNGQQPGKNKTVWFDTASIADMPAGAVHVYWGVNPTNGIPQRVNKKTGQPHKPWGIRAELGDIAAVNCLFGDFDAKDFAGSKQAAYEHIRYLQLPPSALVDSGGGYQAYWLFREPVIIDSPDTLAAMRELQARWVEYIGSDPGAKDLARVLRVPGSKNYKYQPAPVVSLLYADLDIPYGLDDFYRLLPQPQQAAAGSNGNGQQKPSSPGRENTPEDWQAHFLQQAIARASRGSRNKVGFWLACQLRDAGISQGLAGNTMERYQQAVNDAKAPYYPKESMDSLHSAYRLPARPIAQRAAPSPSTTAGAAGQRVNGNGNGHQPQQPAPAAAVPAQISEESLLPSVVLGLKEIHEAWEQQEAGDSHLFAKLFFGKVCYDHTESQWYIWAGHHWEPDHTGIVCWLVARGLAPQYLHGAADALKGGKDELNKELIKRARALQNKKRIDNVLYLAARHEDIRLSGLEWDKNPWLLGCQNGVIDLHTGQLRAGQPADYIRSYSQVTWAGVDAPAPRWEKFIGEIYNEDTALTQFMARLLGYGITGLVTEHIFPILWGEDGRNGKSTMLETLGDVLGDSLSTSSQADALMDLQKQGNGPQPFIYALRGKRLVWASETNEGRRINAGLVKQLTGGDRLNVRTLHSKPIEFKPSYLLLMLTNPKPHISAEDRAIWERVLLVPHTMRFIDNPTAPNERQRDADLKTKLAAELPGILAWLVRGCLEWQRDGLGIPESIKAATDKYRLEEDTTALFYNERCIIKEGLEVKASDLYKEYTDWAKESGINHPMSLTAFGKVCRKRFTAVEKRGIYYQGIGLGIAL
jgi:putative DNA primase/helicase